MPNLFTGNDIEVFVLTFNRADLISETLESLLSQTAEGLRIHVLDNASADSTSDVVTRYLRRGVIYHRFETNRGWKGNFERAQAMSERSWSLLFHDDDLLHPRYLEWALRMVNSVPNATLVASRLQFDAVPINSWPAGPLSPRAIRCDQARDLAALMYRGYPLCFSSVLYRTAHLKAARWEAEVYGKIADRPLLLAIAQHGPAVVLDHPFVRYRVHSAQDSASAASGPFAGQLAALHRCYRSLLGDKGSSAYGRCFLANNYRLLLGEYAHLSAADRGLFPEFGAYFRYMRSENAATSTSRAIGATVTRIGFSLIKAQRILRHAAGALTRWMR